MSDKKYNWITKIIKIIIHRLKVNNLIKSKIQMTERRHHRLPRKVKAEMLQAKELVN